MRTKFFVILILAAIIPSIVFAQTDNSSALILSLQKQILQLLTQIQTLQKEVTELKTETGIQVPSISPAPTLDGVEVGAPTENVGVSPVELPEFTRSLSLGTRGDDVRKLQEFLARDREIYPEGLTTGYYGPATQRAVRRWQRTQGIESVGVVGPKTIAKFRELGQVPRLGSGQGVVRGLIEQGAGRSGMVPPGLLMAPGIQRQMATSTSSGQATTAPTVVFPVMATSTSVIATTTQAIPAVPATLAIPAQPTQTSAVPAAPAISAVPATTTTASSTPTTTYTPGIAPIISNVQATNITSNTAVIIWNTDKPTDTQVEYGLNNLYGLQTTLNNPLVTSHSANLTGLNPATTYHYRVKSKDASGYYATMNDYTFTTLSSGTSTTTTTTDLTPPTITLAVGYPNLTTQTQPIYVGFSANEEVKVTYEYGLTTNYGSIQTVWDQYYTANGTYLPTLSSGTTYHVRAKATDRAGNVGYSQDYTFTTISEVTTGPPTAPGNLTASLDTYKSVRLSWQDTSNNETHFKVQRRTAGGGWESVAQPATDSTSYSEYVSSDENTYEYMVSSCNNSGCADSNTTTITLGAPKAAINLTASVNGSTVSLTWTDNSNIETQYSVSRRLPGVSSSYVYLATLSPNATSYSESNVSPATYEYLINVCTYYSTLRNNVCKPPTIVTVTVNPAVSTSSEANCFVKVNGSTIKSVTAADRNNCYNQTSFGSQNCSVYDSYFQSGSNLLEQYFGQTDRVNSDTCVKSTSTTATTTSAVLDSLGGLLQKLKELLRKR